MILIILETQFGINTTLESKSIRGTGNTLNDAIVESQP
jgi:hypothetical protein